jgi:hypothetical protein
MKAAASHIGCCATQAKAASQPAFTLDAACDNVVFPQADHSVGSHIGSIDRNAKVSCRCNGFAPWLRPVILVRLSDPLIESATYCECMATQGSVRYAPITNGK